MLKMPRVCSVGMPNPDSIKNSDIDPNFLSLYITESFIFYKNSALDFGWLWKDNTLSITPHIKNSALDFGWLDRIFPNRLRKTTFRKINGKRIRHRSQIQLF